MCLLGTLVQLVLLPQALRLSNQSPSPVEAAKFFTTDGPPLAVKAPVDAPLALLACWFHGITTM